MTDDERRVLKAQRSRHFSVELLFVAIPPDSVPHSDPEEHAEG